jgi:hypothetical protein
MGDYYNVVELDGLYYIEYCNANTKWKPVAVKLTPDQYGRAEAFSNKQADESREFLQALSEE